MRDKIEDLGDWIVDKILAPFKEWVFRAIENIIVALRIFRHNLRQKLAEWLENDWFFLAFVAAIAATIYFIPKLIVKMQSWVVTIWVQSMAIKLKENVVALIDINKLIDLHLLHNILLVVWEEYANTFYDFCDAVSQLATELGEGSAYIHAYFSSARVIMHGTNAVLGGDPLQVEVEWYDRTSAFFIRADERFARYARDPGRLYYDFMEEVLLPAAQEQRDVNQEELDQIRENYNRSVQVETGMKDIRLGLDSLVEAFPGEIEAQLRDRWDPINARWLEIEELWNSQIMATIGKIVDAVEEHHQEQLAINRAAEANQRSARVQSDILMGMDVNEQRIMGDTYDYFLALSMGVEIDELRAASTQYNRDYDSITARYIAGLGISPALGYEPIDIISRPDLLLNIPSPFVGDY